MGWFGTRICLLCGLDHGEAWPLKILRPISVRDRHWVNTEQPRNMPCAKHILPVPTIPLWTPWEWGVTHKEKNETKPFRLTEDPLLYEAIPPRMCQSKHTSETTRTDNIVLCEKHWIRSQIVVLELVSLDDVKPRIRNKTAATYPQHSDTWVQDAYTLTMLTLIKVIKHPQTIKSAQTAPYLLSWSRL